jgi:hypothetical protein
MRSARLAAVVTLTGVLALGGTAVLVSAHRQAAFASAAASLRRTWAQDLAAGVPASSIASLEKQLRSQQPDAAWWSPLWWTSDGASLISRLQSATQATYTAAVAGERAQAEAAMSAWNDEVSRNPADVPAAEVTAAKAWPAELQSARTPDQLASLAAAWDAQLIRTRREVQAAELAAQQRARVAADLAAVGGPSGLSAQAQSAVDRARSDNLDPLDVPSLLAALKSEVSAGAPVDSTVEKLTAALQALDQVFTLNDELYGEMRPIELLADQAAAEGTPNASSFLSQYQSLDSAYLAAATLAQLSPLQGTAASLQSAIQSALNADECGHNVGSGPDGKVITISISLEEMVLYQNGCVVKATAVTTGRPGFITPTGYFHVFYKTSPFEMISEYPYGSPGWYEPTWVQWVMEFAGGGYFIHDAYWENQGAFGPGSQYDVAQDWASHGCVHVPTSLMPWVYSWTPMGTPVDISA